MSANFDKDMLLYSRDQLRPSAERNHCRHAVGTSSKIVDAKGEYWASTAETGPGISTSTFSHFCIFFEFFSA